MVGVIFALIALAATEPPGALVGVYELQPPPSDPSFQFEASYEIRALNPRDGSQVTLRPAKSKDETARDPQLTPDGKRLAFTLDAPHATYTLRLLDLAKHTEVTLATLDDGEYSYSWSPDGALLALAYRGAEGTQWRSSIPRPAACGRSGPA